MPSPVTPQNFKAIIPGLQAGMCDKFNDALQVFSILSGYMDYLMDDAGMPGPDFKIDLCALGCIGSGTGTGSNPNMPAPTNPQASDGTFADHIHVHWDAVTPPTGIAVVSQYKIYRSISTVLNPDSAALVGTVSAPIVEFDDPVDGDLTTGSIYNYWVRATNGTNESGFSARDQGNASAVTTTLSAVSDLAATQGYSDTPDGHVSLVWTPTSGASKWTIYRNTVNDAPTAVAIETNITPNSTGSFDPLTGKFWDNDGELVYFDDPPISNSVYYYWVVGSKDSPPATSPKSNVASGWLNDPDFGTYHRIDLANVLTIENTETVHVILFGGGAGGAGGGVNYGSGGGGGGAVAIGDKAVVAGSKMRVTSSPNTDVTSNADGQVNGDNGFIVKLQYSADGLFDDTVDLITTTAPSGGIYSSSGGGAGGSGGGASVSGGVINSSIIPGRAGGAAIGPNGGKSGYIFGSRRLPMGNRFGPSDPSNGDAGSGSRNSVTLASNPDFKGGSGRTGWAVIAATGGVLT